MMEGSQELIEKKLPKEKGSELNPTVNLNLPPNQYDAVLIDNDYLVTLLWLRAAKSKGINLLTYSSFADFVLNRSKIEKNTPIYIDSILDGDSRGESEAKIIFYEFGFRNIILATGDSSISKDDFPWISQIIGKEPPW